MVSFEIFVKAMPPSLSELKVLPSFCFAFKIPDDRAVTNTDLSNLTNYDEACIPSLSSILLAVQPDPQIKFSPLIYN